MVYKLFNKYMLFWNDPWCQATVFDIKQIFLTCLDFDIKLIQMIWPNQTDKKTCPNFVKYQVVEMPKTL